MYLLSHYRYQGAVAFSKQLTDIRHLTAGYSSSSSSSSSSVCDSYVLVENITPLLVFAGFTSYSSPNV